MLDQLRTFAFLPDLHQYIHQNQDQLIRGNHLPEGRLQGSRKHRLPLLQEPFLIASNEVQEIQDVGAETARCEL